MPKATLLVQVVVAVPVAVSVKSTEPDGRPVLPAGTAIVALNENPDRLTVGVRADGVIAIVGLATPIVIEKVCTLPLKLLSPV